MDVEEKSLSEKRELLREARDLLYKLTGSGLEV
jgi:hypothetical protein